MDIYRLAGKVVAGVAVAVVVNRITPYVEEASEQMIKKAAKVKSEASK